MDSRLVVFTATLWAFVATGMTGAAQKVDLTDKPAVQDAVVNFGYPVHGTGHGVAIYPVSKNTTRAHISEDLCQGVYGPDSAGASGPGSSR